MLPFLYNINMESNFKKITKDLYKKTKISKESATLIFDICSYVEIQIFQRDCFKRMGSIFRATHELFLEEIRDFEWVKHHLDIKEIEEHGRTVYRFDKTLFKKAMKHDLYKTLVTDPIQYSNKYSHFNKEDIRMILDKLRIKEPSFNDVINFLQCLFNGLKSLIQLNDSGYNISFNKNLYDDSNLMWKDNAGAKVIQTYENKQCNLCKEGKLIKPKDARYEFGPFLICDNCEAILSKNLNLKVEDKNKKCNKCASPTKISFSLISNKKHHICINKKCLYEKIIKG